MIGFVIHESMNHEVLLLQTLSSFETLLYVVPAFKKNTGLDRELRLLPAPHCRVPVAVARVS